jgi:hypothetical protein
MWIITIPPITKRRASLLVKKVLRLNIQQAPLAESRLTGQQLHGLPLADPVQLQHARDVDEEACICSSPDLIACPGANQIVIQERDGARRQLCADWPDRRRQTGLFDEVREFAGTAAAGSNQGGAPAAPGAGSATQRDFRLVL